jgi:hypothetical protein
MVSVVTPEDLVISKLLWSETTQSDYQLKDVKQLLEERQEVDMTYVYGWCRKLGILELLKRAENG